MLPFGTSVSFDDDDVKAELSMPASVKGNNFFGFIERIFLVTSGGWGGFATPEADEGPIEVLPTVERR